MSDLHYRAHIFCCSNQRPAGHKLGCCFDHDAEHLRNYMKRRAKEMGLEDIRVNNAGCLGRCEFGPAMVIYPEGTWYRPQNEADIEEILTTHLQQGQRVERLLIPHDPQD